MVEYRGLSWRWGPVELQSGSATGTNFVSLVTRCYLAFPTDQELCFTALVVMRISPASPPFLVSYIIQPNEIYFSSNNRSRDTHQLSSLSSSLSRYLSGVQPQFDWVRGGNWKRRLPRRFPKPGRRRRQQRVSLSAPSSPVPPRPRDHCSLSDTCLFPAVTWSARCASSWR